MRHAACFTRPRSGEIKELGPRAIPTGVGNLSQRLPIFATLCCVCCVSNQVNTTIISRTNLILATEITCILLFVWIAAKSKANIPGHQLPFKPGAVVKI